MMTHHDSFWLALGKDGAISKSGDVLSKGSCLNHVSSNLEATALARFSGLSRPLPRFCHLRMAPVPASRMSAEQAFVGTCSSNTKFNITGWEFRWNLHAN